MYASVAQSVEQRTENPCVGGSIPPRGTILIFVIICRLPTLYNNNILCWCGSTVEQLTCNQQVVGSIPITSSILFLGRLQSGQMQRTVNPSTQSSMVRIHPFPPNQTLKRVFFCFSGMSSVDFQSTYYFVIWTIFGTRVPVNFVATREICFAHWRISSLPTKSNTQKSVFLFLRHVFRWFSINLLLRNLNHLWYSGPRQLRCHPRNMLAHWRISSLPLSKNKRRKNIPYSFLFKQKLLR